MKRKSSRLFNTVRNFEGVRSRILWNSLSDILCFYTIKVISIDY